MEEVEWNEYTPPKNILTRAIQYPHDDNYASRIVDAYMTLERQMKKERNIKPHTAT